MMRTRFMHILIESLRLTAGVMLAPVMVLLGLLGFVFFFGLVAVQSLMTAITMLVSP